MTTFLVASTGGHLAELHDLAPRLDVGDDRCWVTFDTPQSRSLLDGEEVVYVPYAASRDVVGAFRDFVEATRLVSRGRVTRVISTGASVAGSFFVPAAARRIACHYIESATRTDRPSMTGQLVARIPGTRLYTQYKSWENSRWRYGGSVFDAYVAEPDPLPRPVKRIVVTLGTHRDYRFPRLLTHLVNTLPSWADVLWQVGPTQIPEMPADARDHVPFAELQEAMREADVVITHAGVGSALDALRAGHRAIYVPRRRKYLEHVDDHQVAMARELHARGLVLAREADEITLDDLELAAAWTVRANPDLERFRLL
jgi:UDP-N-acetylglucosamine--N-acetylmuramyl-(pentapeptide) pyrophosphoryl-undecaprenol N-acetylglucosamine transferase